MAARGADQPTSSSAYRPLGEALPNPGPRPDPYPQRFALLVEQGLTPWRWQPLRLEHRRATREQMGAVQRPGMMENSGSIEPASASGIETVPLDEEEIQRTRPGFPQPVADRPRSFELGRRRTTARAP